MREHTYSFYKESEIRSAYMEQSNLHFNNVANINVDSDSITPHKGEMVERKTVRKIIKFLFFNESNKSIIAIKIIESNASAKNEPNKSQTIEQIVSKTVDMSKTIEQNASKTIKAGTSKYFLTYINNQLS